MDGRGGGGGGGLSGPGSILLRSQPSLPLYRRTKGPALLSGQDWLPAPAAASLLQFLVPGQAGPWAEAGNGDREGRSSGPLPAALCSESASVTTTPGGRRGRPVPPMRGRPRVDDRPFALGQLGSGLQEAGGGTSGLPSCCVPGAEPSAPSWWEWQGPPSALGSDGSGGLFPELCLDSGPQSLSHYQQALAAADLPSSVPPDPVSSVVAWTAAGS